MKLSPKSRTGCHYREDKIKYAKGMELAHKGSYPLIIRPVRAFFVVKLTVNYLCIIQYEEIFHEKYNLCCIQSVYKDEAYFGEEKDQE